MSGHMTMRHARTSPPEATSLAMMIGRSRCVTVSTHVSSHVLAKTIMPTDDVTTMGSIGIVHRDQRVVAIFVVSCDTAGGKHGVISTLDPDAGTWFVDEPVPAPSGLSGRLLPQCRQCSRYGHNTISCVNMGVSPSDKQFSAKKKRSREERQRRSEIYVRNKSSRQLEQYT